MRKNVKGKVSGCAEKRVAKAIAVEHRAEQMMMDFGIQDWYVNTFTTDEVGKDIKSSVKFIDVVNALNKRKDVYKVIGVSDSVVRERVFGEIASRLGIDYDEVYNIWLADKVVAA